jgi:hypothetical protein
LLSGYGRVRICLSSEPLSSAATLLGKSILRPLTLTEQRLADLLLKCNVNTEGIFYGKACVYGQQYHTAMYLSTRNRPMRRNNCIVVLESGECAQLQSFCCVTAQQSTVIIIFCEVLRLQSLPLIGSHGSCNATASNIRSVVSQGPLQRELIAINASSLKQKCIFIDEDDACFVCILPTKFERE